MHRSPPRGVARALGLALVLLATAACAAVPEVEVRRQGRPKVSLAQPFVGVEPGGAPAIYKSNAPVFQAGGSKPVMVSGNLEAEWLSARMMQRIGLPAPDVDIVRIQGETYPHARVQHIRERFPGATLAEGYWSLPAHAKVDMVGMRQMLAMDLLIGNADRHGGNMWFLKDAATGTWRPIPFDHNVSMGTQRAIGLEAGSFAAFERPMVKTKDGISHPTRSSEVIFTKNSAYHATVKDSRAAIGLLSEARALQATLTEADIRSLVAGIPDEAIGSADKAARRQELVEHLLRRRRELVPTAEAVLRNHPDYLRSEWRLAGLPEGLRQRLPADLEARWKFVDALRPDGTFDRGRLRGALAATGVSAATSHEVQSLLHAQGGVKRSWIPGSRGRGLGEAPGTARKAGLEYTADMKRSRIPSYDLLELHQGAAGPELKGLHGHELAPEHSGVRKVMDLAHAQVKLEPGERIRVARKPTGLQGIQVHVVDAGGQVIGKTRYHTFGGTPLRTASKLKLTRRVAVRPEIKVHAKVRVKPKIRLRGLR